MLTPGNFQTPGLWCLFVGKLRSEQCKSNCNDTTILEDDVKIAAQKIILNKLLYNLEQNRVFTRLLRRLRNFYYVRVRLFGKTLGLETNIKWEKY